MRIIGKVTPRALAQFVAWTALAASAVALFLAPGPRPLVQSGGARVERAEVLEVDDSGVQLHGLVEFGTECLTVRLRDGREAKACNELRAQLELDKKFRPGDTALVVVPEGCGPDDTLVARDHWRLGWAFALFAALYPPFEMS